MCISNGQVTQRVKMKTNPLVFSSMLQNLFLVIIVGLKLKSNLLRFVVSVLQTVLALEISGIVSNAGTYIRTNARTQLTTYLNAI